ncbi:MAG: restriction endonuclease [Myxococcales bacterium]|nr:restriction endonuclease [Myxococcales bacterium]
MADRVAEEIAETVLAPRAWAIKLGSAGRCVPFCERHGIIGVGWRDVDSQVLASADRDQLWEHVRARCTWYRGDARRIGGATGQLYRFANECREGDYVAYYDPPRKHVRIGRVSSPPLFRDFDLEPPQSEVDIWHYRRLELAADPIPLLDLYGGLKGKLLGPRLSFWELHDAEAVAMLFHEGRVERVSDPELWESFKSLRDLLVLRSQALTPEDWEWLVVDYLKAQGAHVDEREVGGSRAVIDVEATFDHGELGEETWRVQVKRYEGRQVGWEEIEADFRHAGEASFCYVSVFGFTDEARERADAEDVRLLEAGDFARFLLSGKLRRRLREKLRLPFG